MNELHPKVSVLMSVYNGMPFLNESVESILNQTYTDFEFIIINDFSSDDSWKILSRYAEKDSRIRLVENDENIGLTKSLNKALAIARGELIARQDADDISVSYRLEEQIAKLEHDSNTVLVSCNIETIDAEGEITGAFDRFCDDSRLINWYLLFYNHLAGHSQVMFRKRAALSLGGYSEKFRYCQDYELWCRLGETGDFHILPKALLKQRFHKQSISGSKKLEQESYVVSQVQKNLSRFLDKELTKKEIVYLTGFWVGHWWSEQFPPAMKAPEISSQLYQISKGFVEHTEGTDKNLDAKIKQRIGAQFISWTKSISPIKSFPDKVMVSMYALLWNSPSEVFACWSEDFRRIFQKKVSIYRSSRAV